MEMKRKAETLAQSSPSALDPSSVARQPKAKPAASLLTLRKGSSIRLDKVREAICDRLHWVAARCGFDEGEVAAVMMARPVMKATHIFDLIQEPVYEHT
jgi:hypothetical protein